MVRTQNAIYRYRKRAIERDEMELKFVFRSSVKDPEFRRESLELGALIQLAGHTLNPFALHSRFHRSLASHGPT